MKVDVSEELFSMVDRVLSEVVPEYQNQLEEFGISLDYIYIDRVIQQSLEISMIDREVTAMGLEALVNIALEDDQVTEYERECFLMMSRLNIDLRN